MVGKLEILKAPLSELDLSSRLIVRSVLLSFGSLIRVENESVHEPSDEPVIYAMNHNNAFETLLIACYLHFRRGGKRVAFVVDWIFGHLPLLGWLIRKSDPVFVFHKKARYTFLQRLKKKADIRDVISESVSRLRSDRCLAIFPEGTRNPDPDSLKAGRLGLGKIVLRSGAAVVPIGLVFPARARRQKVPSFGRMIIRIGEPIYFREEIEKAGLEGSADTALQNGNREEVRNLEKIVTHRVMVELSRLSGKNYPFSSGLHG